MVGHMALELGKANVFSLLRSSMFADEPVPIYGTLSDVFGTVQASLPHGKRWNDLAEQFELRFGRKPAYIVRAPGRVK